MTRFSIEKYPNMNSRSHKTL